MAKIKMDPDEVRYLARLLDQNAEKIFQKADELRRQSRRLSSAWSGGSHSNRYIDTLNNWIRQCETKGQELQTLSIRANREVDEWVSVDNSAEFQGKRVTGRFLNYVGEMLETAPGVYKKLEEIDQIKALVGLGLIETAGTTYVGQKIIKGSHSLKEAAGLPAAITHARDATLISQVAGKASHVSGLDIAFAGIEFLGMAAQDCAKYEKGTEKATAIAVDAVFVAAKTVATSYVAGVVITAVAGAVITTFGAPVLVAAAVGVGAAMLINMGIDYLAGKGLEAVKDPIVKAGGQALDAVGKGISSAFKWGSDLWKTAARAQAKMVDQAFSGVINTTKSLFAGI